MLINLGVIMRYILVFFLKNPAGFKDGFWFAFAMETIVCFAVLQELAKAALIGHSDGIGYYMCVGKKPLLNKVRKGNKKLFF